MKKLVYVINTYSHKKGYSLEGDLRNFLSEAKKEHLTEKILNALRKIIEGNLIYSSLETFLQKTNFLIFLSPSDYLDKGWLSDYGDVLEDFLFEEKFLSLRFEKPVENKPLPFEGGYCCFDPELAKKLLFEPNVNRLNAHFYRDFYLTNDNGLMRLYKVNSEDRAWWTPSDNNSLPTFFEEAVIWEEKKGYTLTQNACVVPLLSVFDSFELEENFLITKKGNVVTILDSLNLLNTTPRYSLESSHKISFVGKFIVLSGYEGGTLIIKKETLSKNHILKKEDKYKIENDKVIVNEEVVFE